MYLGGGGCGAGTCTSTCRTSASRVAAAGRAAAAVRVTEALSSLRLHVERVEQGVELLIEHRALLADAVLLKVITRLATDLRDEALHRLTEHSAMTRIRIIVHSLMTRIRIIVHSLMTRIRIIVHSLMTHSRINMRSLMTWQRHEVLPGVVIKHSFITQVSREKAATKIVQSHRGS